MKTALFSTALAAAALSLSSCGALTTGVVVSKSFEPAYTETRTREVYTTSCGYYRPAGEMMKKFGCGTGYFDEDYEAQVAECHAVVIEHEDKQATWCTDTGSWERAQIGDTYRHTESAYSPGTEESEL